MRRLVVPTNSSCRCFCPLRGRIVGGFAQPRVPFAALTCPGLGAHCPSGARVERGSPCGNRALEICTPSGARVERGLSFLCLKSGGMIHIICLPNSNRVFAPTNPGFEKTNPGFGNSIAAIENPKPGFVCAVGGIGGVGPTGRAWSRRGLGSVGPLRCGGCPGS